MVYQSYIPCSPNKVTVQLYTSAQNLKLAENWLFLQIEAERILNILWAFLIKQLFHLRMLDKR